MTIKVVFIPGNNNASTKENWFPKVKQELEHANLNVIASVFPDSDLARYDYWIPFLKNEIKVDNNTILIGHSTGAVAAMRIAESQPILGSVLVGVYHTNLGMEKEIQSGYFDKPWNWNAIKKNQQWTIIFASQDDPWIHIDEPRFIHSKLNCEYHEYRDQGHFGGDYSKPDFPELSQFVLRKLSQESNRQ